MVCLPTVKRGSSNGGESYEKYRNPALFDRNSGVTTGYPALRLDAVIDENFKRLWCMLVHEQYFDGLKKSFNMILLQMFSIHGQTTMWYFVF